jgi:hypothetical protein
VPMRAAQAPTDHDSTDRKALVPKMLPARASPAPAADGCAHLERLLPPVKLDTATVTEQRALAANDQHLRRCCWLATPHDLIHVPQPRFGLEPGLLVRAVLGFRRRLGARPFLGEVDRGNATRPLLATVRSRTRCAGVRERMPCRTYRQEQRPPKHSHLISAGSSSAYIGYM